MDTIIKIVATIIFLSMVIGWTLLVREYMKPRDKR